MDKIITIEDIEQYIFFYLDKRIVLCGEYSPKIQNWTSGGGVVGKNIDIPFVVHKDIELPRTKTKIICEGSLNIAQNKIEKPLAISIKCNFKCNHYISDSLLIDHIMKKDDDAIDSGFERIIHKFSLRKKPKILLLHPESKTSKEDVIKSMAESVDKYIIDDKVLKYSTFTEDDGDSDKYVESLLQYDKIGYDAICFISGGRGNEDSGYGLLHKEKVIKTISKMKTPTIGGIGHSDESHIFDFVFNRTISTPSMLGVELKEYSKISIPTNIHQRKKS